MCVLFKKKFIDFILKNFRKGKDKAEISLEENTRFQPSLRRGLRGCLGF